jgi:hypothetical protein
LGDIPKRPEVVVLILLIQPFKGENLAKSIVDGAGQEEAH